MLISQSSVTTTSVNRLTQESALTDFLLLENGESKIIIES